MLLILENMGQNWEVTTQFLYCGIFFSTARKGIKQNERNFFLFTY